MKYEAMRMGRLKKKRKTRRNKALIGITLLPAVICVLLFFFFSRDGFRFPDPKIDETPPPAQNDPPGVVDIGFRREVFWDDYLIDTQKTTARRVLHEAQKQGLALEMDGEWEGGGGDCFNIVEDGGLYRLYYLAYGLPEAEAADTARPEVKVCYAESADGLTWEKKKLNMVEYGGSTDNNILLYEKNDIFYNFFVFIDANAATPAGERYKALAVSESDNRLLAYTSSDGLRWRKRAALSGALGDGTDMLSSLNTAFWDEARQRYYCYYVRTAEGGAREICVTSSVDFRAWTRPQSLSYGDDPERFNLLTANIAPYYRAPHVYMGLPLRLTDRSAQNAGLAALTRSPARENPAAAGEKYAAGLTDTLFITSRNGLDWNLNKGAWLLPGAEHDGNWMYGDTYTAHGMIETPSPHGAEGQDNELSLYVSEGKWSGGGAKLYRYTARIDGFASYTAAYATRKVVTKPFKFGGGRMLLNFSTSPGGYVFVRVLDENGEPFPPVEYQDGGGRTYGVPMYTSYEMFGDRVDREVAFNGDLAELSGRTVVLEFYMSDADIYSFRFDDMPYENTAEWQPAEIPVREYEDFEYADDGAVLDIGSRRELFWDNYIIDAGQTDAALTAKTPVRREALFDTDKPWEGSNCDYYNITKDEDESGRAFYRMYYLGWGGDVYNEAEMDIRVCYAYSYDGREWIKPNLGIHAYRDPATGVTYSETNIILYGEEPIFDNFFVMRDPRADIPDGERYKAVAQGYSDPDGNDSYGLWAWLSADGVHWRKSHRILPPPANGIAFDSLNTLTWDEETRRYYIFFRVREEETAGGVTFPDYRKVVGCASGDFYSWDAAAVYPLEYGGGAPSFEMYTNNIGKYYRAEHIFLGLPTRFNRRYEWAKNYEYLAGSAERRRKYDSGVLTASLSMTEALFMTSRDGVRWNRRNASWLTPGPEYAANWIYGNCYPASGLIETAPENPGQDNELSAYVFEGKFYYDRPSTLYRYTMRIDGMACYKAEYGEQKVTTKAFTFSGDELLLNFRTSAAGYVRVRLLNGDGSAIEGYDSGEIFGDRVDRRITFEKSPAELNGLAVKLEITMSDAEVYSFKFD